MTDRRLRILLVLGTSTGGIGQHVRSLAEGLVARGHRVVVAGPAETDELFEFSAGGARFVPAEIGVTPSPRDLVVARSLSRWVKGADVVHAHGFRAGLVALSGGAGRGWPVAAVRAAGVPLVVTWHNQVLAGGLKGNVMHRVEAMVARGATISLGASADLVAQARAAGGTAILGPVAPPTPAASQTTPLQVRAALGLGDEPVVLAVGRLHPQKDYPTLVAAMAQLQSRRPRPVLVVAGDGPEAARVQSLVDEQQVDARLLGRRNDVADLMIAADVLAMPSVWEARSLVVQEAMQVGLPVVATRVGGLPELIGPDGLLVQPGDVAGLAHAIGSVLDDPVLGADLAERARSRARSWPTEDDVVDRVVDVYRGLPPSPGGSAGASR
jgi:glycosyltransferase involved in cell wall biosynthesis